MAQAAKKRPAKLASSKKKGGERSCPTCDKDMQVVKIIRHSGPSGMFWRCESGHELPTG
jgi:hypothetical protein